MHSVRFPFRLLSLILVCLGLAASASAQSDRGTIAGTVLDSSGGVVADAKVVATSADTGTVYNATTGPTVGYRIPDVRVGPYNVSVTANGFKTENRTGVVVQVNTTASLDFSLQPGSVSETLTVVGD